MLRLRPGLAVQSSAEIDWKSYEKEVDPEVLKMFKDSFSCRLPCTTALHAPIDASCQYCTEHQLHGMCSSGLPNV